MSKFLPARLVRLMLMASGSMACALQGAEPSFFKIHSRWYQNEWLGEEQGKAVCKEGAGESFQWRMEEKDGKLRLLNKATGDALQAATEGVAACNAPNSAENSQWWARETVSGPWQTFRSDKERYLNIEHRLGGPASDMEGKPTDQDRWSGQWEMIRTEGPPPPRNYPVNMVSVFAPDYGSDIGDNVKIHVLAPGLKDLVATTWKNGVMEKVASVTLGEGGAGSFEFKADGFPKGPLMLRLHGTNGENVSDNCFLQLYHTRGPDKSGAGKAPAQAKGMKEIFVDDFAKPLSISSGGKDATYAAHKPGGGDFSGIPFANPEGAGNPFSERDGFLRIRADEIKNTTGLLSSLRFDGTGVVAKAPCYFECRFIAQSATGTWPAFWVMTQDTWKGGNTPVDELDVIEAYGGEGPGNPNFPGYEVTSHFWNQGENGQKDSTQPGLHTQVAMTAKPFRGSSWYEDFHTYGVKIGKDETIYYCDDIEVGRHPTAKVSKEQPFFFFINFAIGGISGWKKDLSRYGGAADMYVDYVRVFAGE